jgi:uncharacterized membrane protein
VGKGRMEAFSDGVMAFAITLLVLDIALRPPGSPTQQFLRAWPSYLAYLVSFLTIGAVWVAHQGLTDRLEQVDSIFLRLNLLLLLAIAFLPISHQARRGWPRQELGVAAIGRRRVRTHAAVDPAAIRRNGRLRPTGGPAETRCG